MAARPGLALTLALALACGGESTSTMTDSSTGGTDGTGGSTGTTETSAGTGETPTTSGTATDPTGGTGGGTDSASGGDPTGDTTGSGTTEMSGGSGGQGSGMACLAWYAAIEESYGPICECEVQQGNFESVEACMAALAPPADCACDLFARSPETAELLNCYEEAAKEKAECLGGLGNLCLGNMPIDLCVNDELEALIECGAPPDELCQDLEAMCGDAVPPICG